MKKQKPYSTSKEFEQSDLGALQRSLGISEMAAGEQPMVTHEEYEQPVLSPKNLAENAFIDTWDFVNQASFGLSTATTAIALGTLDTFAGTNTERDFAGYRKELEERHGGSTAVAKFAGDIAPWLYGAGEAKAGLTVAKGLGEAGASKLAKKEVSQVAEGVTEGTAEKSLLESTAEQTEKIEPFISGTEGYFYKALRMPGAIARGTVEGIPKAYSAEALANTVFTPAVGKFIDSGVTGAIYGGFSGFASGISDEDMYNGFSMDSFKNVGMSTVLGGAYGALFGAATNIVHQGYTFSKAKWFGDNGKNIKFRNTDIAGMTNLLDTSLAEMDIKLSAAGAAGDEELLSKLKGSHEKLKKNKEQLLSDMKVLNDAQEAAFRGEEVDEKALAIANTNLDILAGADTGVDRRAVAKLFSTEDTLSLEEVHSMRTRPDEMKVQIAKELNEHNKRTKSPAEYKEIKPSEVNIREDSMKLLNIDLNAAYLHDENFLNNSERAMGDFIEVAPQVASPASSSNLQWQSAVDAGVSLLTKLDEETAIRNTNYFTEPGFDITKTLQGKYLPGTEDAMRTNKLTLLKGGDPESYDTYVRTAKAAIGEVNLTMANGSQGDVFKLITRMKQALDKAYGAVQTKVGLNYKIPPEVAKLHSTLQGSIDNLANNEALFGKIAVNRNKLRAVRAKRLSYRNTLENIFKVKPGQKNAQGFEFDSATGQKVEVKAPRRGLPARAVSRFKFSGNATGPLEIREMGPQYMAEYLKAMSEEAALTSDIIDQSVAHVDTQLNLYRQTPARAPTYSKGIRASKSAKALSKAGIEATKMQNAPAIAQLEAKKAALLAHKNEVVLKQADIRLRSNAILGRINSVVEYNSMRSQSYADMMMHLSSVASVAAHEQPATKDFKTAPGFQMHGPQRNLFFETTLGVRDAFVGNWNGVGRAVSWGAMNVLQKLGNNILATQMEQKLQYEEMYFLQKKALVDSIAKHQKANKKERIRTRYNFKNKPFPDVRPAAYLYLGQKGADASYKSEEK